MPFITSLVASIVVRLTTPFVVVLVVGRPARHHRVADAVERALAEDVGPLGDITASLVPRAATVVAVVRARQTRHPRGRRVR